MKLQDRIEQRYGKISSRKVVPSSEDCRCLSLKPSKGLLTSVFDGVFVSFSFSACFLLFLLQFQPFSKINTILGALALCHEFVKLAGQQIIRFEEVEEQMMRGWRFLFGARRALILMLKREFFSVSTFNLFQPVSSYNETLERFLWEGVFV